MIYGSQGNQACQILQYHPNPNICKSCNVTSYTRSWGQCFSNKIQDFANKSPCGKGGDQLRVPYKNRAFKFLSYLAIISVLQNVVISD